MIALEQLERLWRSLIGLGGRRLAALAVVGVGVFAAVALGSYYLSRPELETLYAGLSAQDVSRIGAALREAGIAFDVNAQGTAVLVRYGQTAQARMLLAEKGLPASGNAGYELFDKLGSMGLTSFMQEVTRVRALEGEMARTIQAMKGVKAARVHVVLPDTGSFRRSRQNPSASVIIRTEVAGDFNLAPAIRHLVAAAVPGLGVDQVTVLNTDGTILASGGDTFSAAPGKMISLEKAVSRELTDNIAKTLMPYLGINNFEISVTARLNTDKRQTNETSYNPESRVERSVRVVKETGNSQNTNSRSAVSVEQNVPADQTATAAAGDQSKKTSERREETTNYEVSSKTTSTVSDGYKVDNLAIAVVVNRKRLLASLADGVSEEAVDKQLKEVERLIGSAAGVDLKRGDRITVSAVEFIQTGLSLEPVPSVGIVEQLLHHTGSIVSAIAMVAVTMVLIWFGLRPAMRAILEAKPVPAAAVKELRAQAVPGAAPAGAQGIAAEAHPNLISDLTHERDRAPQKRLEQMVDYDEEQAAAVLKDWMRGAQSA
ncbi:MAG TPA: flagellar basal-body MS-ring/collar protein FliF [Hyphomicrobiaceae bacterium]|nr:flagellar basal-body MS-ring/collar protein FliF [Hyphomicrobiaceae bacterium]